MKYTRTTSEGNFVGSSSLTRSQYQKEKAAAHSQAEAALKIYTLELFEHEFQRRQPEATSEQRASEQIAFAHYLSSISANVDQFHRVIQAEIYARGRTNEFLEKTLQTLINETRFHQILYRRGVEKYFEEREQTHAKYCGAVESRYRQQAITAQNEVLVKQDRIDSLEFEILRLRKEINHLQQQSQTFQEFSQLNLQDEERLASIEHQVQNCDLIATRQKHDLELS